VASLALAFDIIGRDKASPALNKVAKSAEHTEGRLGRLAGFGTKALTGLATAAGAAGVAGGFLGIKTAAGMEQAKIAFETMLGSATKADAFLKSLADFAAKTPFEFPELQTAASSLISAGIEANKVIPIMTTLGDVTSGMGTGAEGVKRATIALQQMSAAGRITGEDLNQLRDAGIPVFDLLAKATGKSKAEVVKLAQAGKLGSKELALMMKALETGAGLERFSGLMDKQSRSLTGLWSTFQDTLGQGLARLITPAIPALKAGLGATSAALSDFINGVTGNFAALGKNHTPLTQLALGIRAVFVAFQDGDVTSDGFVGHMERIGIGIRAVFDSIRALLPTLKRFGTAVVLPALKDLATSLSNVWQAIEPKLIAALKTVATVIGVLLVGALAVLGPALTAITGFFKDHETTTLALAAAIGVLVVATKAHAAVMLVQELGGLKAYIVATKAGYGATRVFAAAKWLLNGALMGARWAFHTAALIAHKVATVALSAATKAWAAAQWLLNAALTANPIGLVVVAIAALVAGLVLAYRNSETFRKVVKGAFDAVGQAASFMWNNVIKPVFKLWLKLWFTVVGAMLNGAAKAFGWVPGIGPKLKAAAREFNKFRDSVNASLDGVVTDKTITIHADYQTRGRIPEGYASGTLSAARGWAWVGERGPELMYMRGGEKVVSAVRSRQMAAQATPVGAGTTIEMTNYITVPDRQTALSAPDQLRQSLWLKGL
jgi:tape measure domain-containing protein